MPAEPLRAENVYHIWHTGDTDPEDGRGHDLSLGCWCEPHPHDFGADVAGRPVLVVNHHVPRLWCCAAHRPSPSRRVRIYEKPQAKRPSAPVQRCACETAV